MVRVFDTPNEYFKHMSKHDLISNFRGDQFVNNIIRSLFDFGDFKGVSSVEYKECS